MIHVIGKFGKNPYPQALIIDVTSNGTFKDLSPFHLGPVQYRAATGSTITCQKFENFWQFSKVYPEHVDSLGNPTKKWITWRANGFNLERAYRYPMGKGKKPLYSWWQGERLSYIEARKALYIPTYAGLVVHTTSYKKLYNWALGGHDLVLRDFNGYEGMTMKDVVNNPKRSMGHAFVIKMLLTTGLTKYL